MECSFATHMQKHVFLKMLYVAELPSAGSVTLAGRRTSEMNLRDKALFQKKTAWIQHTPFFVEDCTVEQHICIFLHIHQKTIPLNDLLQRFHLHKTLSAQCNNLSPFHSYLLATSLSFIQDASLWLIDIPFALLTSQESETLFKVLQTCHTQNTVFVLSEPYPSIPHRVTQKIVTTAT